MFHSWKIKTFQRNTVNFMTWIASTPLVVCTWTKNFIILPSSGIENHSSCELLKCFFITLEISYFYHLNDHSIATFWITTRPWYHLGCHFKDDIHQETSMWSVLITDNIKIYFNIIHTERWTCAYTYSTNFSNDMQNWAHFIA